MARKDNEKKPAKTDEEKAAKREAKRAARQAATNETILAVVGLSTTVATASNGADVLGRLNALRNATVRAVALRAQLEATIKNALFLESMEGLMSQAEADLEKAWEVTLAEVQAHIPAE